MYSCLAVWVPQLNKNEINTNSKEITVTAHVEKKMHFQYVNKYCLQYAIHFDHCAYQRITMFYIIKTSFDWPKDESIIYFSDSILLIPHNFLLT